MSNLNISINLLALQGASLITSKAGTECLVIDLNKARTKKHANGKVYLNLEAKERQNGPDQFGYTHIIAEQRTKEERQAKLDMPILGNGKVFDFKKRQDAPKPQETGNAGMMEDDDGDIPF